MQSMPSSNKYMDIHTIQQMQLQQAQMNNVHSGLPLSNMPPPVGPGMMSRQNSGSSAAASMATAAKNFKPNELFIGNLSYFCEEKDLYELFDQYGNVEDVRIIKNDSGTRSLMFGFVSMSSVHEAREMEKLLNHHLFMGRHLRVAISERRYDFKPPVNDGIQMHCSFCSFFNFNDQLIRPTESFLRKFFIQFGTVLDITVKEYAVYHEQNMQEGYGFVSFETEDAIMRALSACQNVIVQGITLKCTITHQHNPHSKKNKKSTSPTAAAAAAMAAVSMRENANKLYGAGSISSSPSHPSMSGPGLVSSGMGIGVNWPSGPSTSHNTSSLSALNPHLPLPNHLVINNFMPTNSTGTSPRLSMQFPSNDSSLIASSMESLPSEFDHRASLNLNGSSVITPTAANSSVAGSVSANSGYNPFKPVIEAPVSW